MLMLISTSISISYHKYNPFKQYKLFHKTILSCLSSSLSTSTSTSTSTSSSALTSIELRNNDRNSHDDFFYSRDWNICSNFWMKMIQSSTSSLPEFIKGDDIYGITNMKLIHDAGILSGEYSSK